MVTATIKKILNSDIQSVWETVLCVNGTAAGAAI